MTTGMMVSPIGAVRALNVLQNSMMLTPCWPSAGPTGGAGVAFPAGIWSFTYPVIFFIRFSCVSARGRTPGQRRVTTRAAAPGAVSDLLHLEEAELHGCRTSEDGHHDLERVLVFVELLDLALERGEGALGDAHRLTLLERELGL